MPDTLGADVPAGPLSSMRGDPDRKRARLKPDKADNPRGGTELPTEADGPISEVMLSGPGAHVPGAPPAVAEVRAPEAPSAVCELPSGTPDPHNRVAQRVEVPEMFVSTVGDGVAIGRTKESAIFYEEMKLLGFRSLEDVREYLELSRVPWPELEVDVKVAANHPRLRHEFQSGPWDPTWRWCWEQVTKFGYSVAPKRVEADVRFLLEVDL